MRGTSSMKLLRKGAGKISKVGAESHLNLISSRSKGYSMMPVVGTLTRRMSCCVGR